MRSPSTRSILVYNGPGASPRCVAAVLVALASHVDTGVEVRTCNAEELSSPGWESSTLCIVMPGGRDLPYCEALAGEPCARIRAFVEDGGSYLGLCAGAYFGSARCEFAVGTPLEVRGDRELAFFPGVARGPVFGGFEYERGGGAHAAPITFVEQSTRRMRTTRCYYEGGCRFDPPPFGPLSAPHCEPLCWFASEAPGAAQKGGVAAVACSHGAGFAVLAGIHPELSHACAVRGLPGGPTDDQRDGEPGHVRPQLRAHSLSCGTLWRSLLAAARLPLQPMTVLAYGALMSESSARQTFPSLRRFRAVRVPGVRRTFCVAHLRLAALGASDPARESEDALAIASLAVEPVAQQGQAAANEDEPAGVVCAAFEVELSAAEEEAFALRESAYVFARLPFEEAPFPAAAHPSPVSGSPVGAAGRPAHGLICLAGDDETFAHVVGAEEFARVKQRVGGTVWGWTASSGLRPAPLYLRHCLLAASELGREAAVNFERETTLVDRKTSLSDFLTSERLRDADVLRKGETAWLALPEGSELRAFFCAAAPRPSRL